MSWRVVGLVVTAWVVALALLLPGGAPETDTPAAVPTTAPAAPVDSSRSELRAAVTVLGAWDSRRAQAWAAGDETALLGLYAADSRAGAADAALLRRWSEAGRRVEGLVSQVLAAEVVRVTDDRLVLRVVDRVAGGTVVAASGATTALPGTTAAARTVELRHGPSGWQVASVTPAP